VIKKVVIRNFKAIRDSKLLALGPLNVFIGNNGTGKSSVMEALHCLQLCVTKNLEVGFKEWGGLEKIHNYRTQGKQFISKKKESKKKNEGIYFSLECIIKGRKFVYETIINTDESGELYVVENESLSIKGKQIYFAKLINNSEKGSGIIADLKGTLGVIGYAPNLLFLNLVKTIKSSKIRINPGIKEFSDYISSWQFLYLNAHDMGKPVLLNPLEKDKKLNYDGRNIAEYLLWLKNQPESYLESLTERLKFILPYLKDVEPHTMEAQGQQVEILMNEENSKRALEGWLLSSGTLRIAALLSMFINPKPPSVLFIDEIENGLDPRTIAFLLEEIKNVTQSGDMQVIFTTHSPYLLDLLSLDSIIVTERDENGAYFRFPSTENELKGWKDKFSPGKLYTSGSLTK
jgi:predicted ATPase